MSEDHAMGFFIISLMIVVAVLLSFGGVKFISDYRAKKAKERKELAEAAKMFEQRIALRPKHMGARLGMGVSADVHFEPANDRKE